MAGKSKVGIVTVTYNSSNVLNDFMFSVLNQSHNNFLLCIIDNASADDTLEKLEQYHDERIVTISNADNVGVAKGNNQGIEYALNDGCDLVLLVNNDTQFENNLLLELIYALTKHNCRMVAPKIWCHDDKQKIWYAGGQFNPWKAHTVKHYGYFQKDCSKYNETKKVSYASTCCLLIEKSVFEEIGMMDEKYFVYVDDIDFCFRALKQNIELFFIHDINFYHKVSSLTGGGNTKFSIYYGLRNRVYFLKKYLSPSMFQLWKLWHKKRDLFQLLFKVEEKDIYELKVKAFKDGLTL